MHQKCLNILALSLDSSVVLTGILKICQRDVRPQNLVYTCVCQTSQIPPLLRSYNFLSYLGKEAVQIDTGTFFLNSFLYQLVIENDGVIISLILSVPFDNFRCSAKM